MNEKFSTFTFVVGVLYKLRTFLLVLAIAFKIFFL